MEKEQTYKENKKKKMKTLESETIRKIMRRKKKRKTKRNEKLEIWEKREYIKRKRKEIRGYFREKTKKEEEI